MDGKPFELQKSCWSKEAAWLWPHLPDFECIEAELAPAEQRGSGDQCGDEPDGQDGDQCGEGGGQRELPVLGHHHEPGDSHLIYFNINWRKHKMAQVSIEHQYLTSLSSNELAQTQKGTAFKRPL